MSKHSSSRNSRFNDMCVEALQETFREVLGASVAEAYMKYAHNFLSIQHEEMAEQLEPIFVSLKNTFGLGGDIISMRMIRKLYAKMGIAFTETPGFTLSDYVKSLKQKIHEKQTD